MLQYIVILLDDTSTSFCHYEVTKEDKNLMPIDTLKGGIIFSMQENLSVQFVYPNYKLPKEYYEVIDTVDHFNIMPSSIAWTDADAIVENDWNIKKDEPLLIPLAIRTGKSDFFDNYTKLKESFLYTKKINIVFTDIETFNDGDLRRYNAALSELSTDIEDLYVNGHSPQLNVLTDRMMLKTMHNCGAGYATITLAPNGKFYICPAFYYEDETDSVGDLDKGFDIKNQRLYKLDYAPICRHCDAWQCERCVWLNRKTTLEVNTPSHEQCVVAHIERNVSRRLLQNIRKHGIFLPDFDDIKEIDYLDPFDKRKEWK